MRRREVISVLGGAAITWPLAARAQRPTSPIIGFLSMASATMIAPRLEGFRLGLRDFGYIEGTNISVVCTASQRDTTSGFLSWRLT
jgi:hypothetical protein